VNARTATAGGVLLHLAGMLLALVLLREAWLSARNAHDHADLLRREFAEMHDKLANHDALAAQLAAMRPMLQALAQRLPDRIDNTTLEQALRTNADTHGLQITDVAWSAEYLHEGFYADRGATFAVQGRSADFAAFLQDLLSAAPSAQVTSMTLTAGEAPHSLRASVRVAFFHYLTEGLAP